MNRLLWGTAAAALFFAVPALAADQREVLEALGKCAGLADDKARLACYDGLAPQVKDALSAPPAAVASAQPPGPPTEEQQKSWFGFDVGGLFGTAPAQQTTPQQFGSDKLPPPPPPPPGTTPAQPPPIDSITAGVTDYAINPFGKFIVFLDNGQVWKQEQGDADRAQFRKNPKDNKITISRGFIGSYNMTLNDSTKVYKVTRVK
jgi:hypothetical protein